MSWGLLALTVIIACIGLGMLYSAADGNLEPWASRQFIRFMVGFLILVAIALVNIRIWMRWAYFLDALGVFSGYFGDVFWMIWDVF